MLIVTHILWLCLGYFILCMSYGVHPCCSCTRLSRHCSASLFKISLLIVVFLWSSLFRWHITVYHSVSSACFTFHEAGHILLCRVHFSMPVAWDIYTGYTLQFLALSRFPRRQWSWVSSRIPRQWHVAPSLSSGSVPMMWQLMCHLLWLRWPSSAPS